MTTEQLGHGGEGCRGCSELS